MKLHQPPNDFYCDQVLSGKTAIRVVKETDNVLAFYHTRPSHPLHIVVIPKTHISSLVEFAPGDDALLIELMGVIREIARGILAERGACRVITNLGDYQESKHLHWHVVSGDRLQTAP